MEIRPLISIIVPIYQAEKTLVRCIDCLLMQSFSNYEILLINDGSTDNSAEICASYASNDPRIKVIHKKNGGISSARNCGLDNAKGEWVTFCDSDDYVTPSWLDNFVENINNCDLVVQGILTDKPLYTESEKGKTIYGIDYTGDAASALSLLDKEKIRGFTWVRLFKKSVIEKYKLRFSDKCIPKEDLEFVLRYMKYCTKVNCTSKAGYFYFVPDWNNKYKKLGLNLELPQSLYLSSREIFNKTNNVTKVFLQEYFQTLLCHIKDGTASVKDVLIFRKDTKNDLMSSPIFAISKFAIRFDPTGLISYGLLKIHSKI